MSLLGFISKQFIDVIQWDEYEAGVLAWRYPTADREIRNGAALTVRETQRACLSTKAGWPTCLVPGFTS